MLRRAPQRPQRPTGPTPSVSHSPLRPEAGSPRHGRRLDLARAQRLGHQAFRAIHPDEGVAQRVPAISRRSGPTVQRLGEIRFANRANNKYTSKATDLIAVLRAAPRIQNFLANKTALITIENAETKTPASVTVSGDQVQIQLAPWFFEKKSRGAILGMLAHEFGVHPIADENLSAIELGNENTRATSRTALATGHGHETIAKDDDNQADHVFGSVAGEPRYTEYIETVYDIVSSMIDRQQAGGVGATITNDHIKEAILSYLADLASILATNDHRLQVYKKADLAAQYFNEERDRWLAFLHGRRLQNEIVQRTPGRQSKSDVLTQIAFLAGNRFLGFFGRSTGARRSKINSGAALTQNQQDLLTSLNKAVQPKPMGVASPTFFDALDGARAAAAGNSRTTIRNMFANGRDQYRNQATALENTNPVLHADAIATNRKSAAELDAYVNKIDNNQAEGELSSDFIYKIAAFLQAKIDVVAMGGKLKRDDHGGSGPYLLLYVSSPNPHYRWAQ